MRFYVAGPMTGIADYNFPAFNLVARKLRAQGHDVFNPAELAVDFSYPDWYRKALAADLEYICLHANAIYMLPGWEHSKGARVEHALACCLQLTITYE